jgi:hypothetical protein
LVDNAPQPLDQSEAGLDAPRQRFPRDVGIPQLFGILLFKDGKDVRAVIA